MSFKINIVPSNTPTPARNNIIFKTLYRNTTRPSDQEILNEQHRHIPDNYVSDNVKISSQKNNNLVDLNANSTMESSKLNVASLINENKENNITNELIEAKKFKETCVKSGNISIKDNPVNIVSTTTNDNLVVKETRCGSPLLQSKSSDKIEYSIQSSNSAFKINVIAPEKPMPESMEKRNYWGIQIPLYVFNF